MLFKRAKEVGNLNLDKWSMHIVNTKKRIIEMKYIIYKWVDKKGKKLVNLILKN